MTLDTFKTWQKQRGPQGKGPHHKDPLDLGKGGYGDEGGGGGYGDEGGCVGGGGPREALSWEGLFREEELAGTSGSIATDSGSEKREGGGGGDSEGVGVSDLDLDEDEIRLDRFREALGHR